MSALNSWWRSLAAREQNLISLTAGMGALALLWLIGMAPALHTLRDSEAQHALADAQLQNMQTLAAQAKVLRTQRSLSFEESQRNLENSVKQTLGANATLSVTDARASLTLKGVSADALALWLSQARINARVVPSEARLQRNATNDTLWDGLLVLALPAR